MEILEKFQLATRYVNEPNIWEEYAFLVNKYNPINLGQGFPDFLPEQHIVDYLVQSANSEDVSLHQSTRYFGHPRLVKALAQLYSPLMKQNIDPYQDIVITAGGFASLYSVITGFVQPGDEVIIIEPFFTCYETMIKTAGGVVRYIPLRLKGVNDVIRSSDWVLYHDELENLFNSKTKAIIINNPHNPLGKVFSLEELEEIANLCKRWDALCISDEVYEWLVYKPKKHIRIASLPGMWERTVTVGSAGKVFLVTGWRVAWAMGPSTLIHKLQVELIFTPGTVQQEAVAKLFENEIERFHESDCYLKGVTNFLETKKNYMIRILTDTGMKPVVPDSGVFVVADWTPLESKIDLSSEKDVYKDFQFTKWFAKNAGLLAMPISMFYGYDNKKIGESFARYCFLKEDKKLQEAEEVLNKWKSMKQRIVAV
ncbi:hypothetical protein FQA39_LY12073 [Lamprigera yunnana]|nr:hypothetical protein FQA39_LY12073 [Lamprigera yunnana]